jgi:hypothetical protein
MQTRYSNKPEPLLVEAKRNTDQTKEKTVDYTDLGVCLGKGKFGCVTQILYKSKICALKKILKSTIDNLKHIQHVKNEK